MQAILVDVTRCTGCERCVEACIEANGTDPVLAQRDRARTRDGLSENRLLSVPEVDGDRFVRTSCMHCLEPSCVAACLVGGLTKTPDGPVLYDPEKCIGCRYCMLACPFSIPRYEWVETTPFVRKCTMCADRLEEGQLPACVEACPHEVLLSGEREVLLREAHRRLTSGEADYLPRIWGEHEYGGTCVLYLSDVDLDALGWPERGAESIPSLTEPLISKTPFIGLGVMGSLLGVNWIIRRRMELQGSGSTSVDGVNADTGPVGADDAAGSVPPGDDETQGRVEA